MSDIFIQPLDAVSQATIKKVSLTPVSVPNVSGSFIESGDTITEQVIGGLAYFSDTIPNIYLVTLYGAYRNTAFYISVPTGSAIINMKDLITPLPQQFNGLISGSFYNIHVLGATSASYSQQASTASFALTAQSVTKALTWGGKWL